jgi:lipopolysaccharide export system permease protein
MVMRYSPVSRASTFNKSRHKIPVISEDSSLINTDPDRTMSSMKAYGQVSVISEALSYARDAKTYISSNSINVDDQARLIRKHDIEWWKKFTLSASCIIFFLIGAPLGAIIRKGGLGMPVVISVLFFVLWYVLTLTSEKFVREGIMPSAIGMWFASLLLLLVGLFLIRKATLDSSMFNVDTYLNPIKAFVNKYLPKKFEFKNLRATK